MPDTSRIYIPKRVSGMLRGIYTSRVTVVSAPDGCGKSTLVREFTSRTRPAGISLRTITGARNTGECFAQICAIVTGQEFAEPLSEREFMAVSQEFAAARPKKPLLIIVDCDCAARTALGNYRTAKLLRDCRCARFVFVSSAMKPAYRGLAHEMGFTLIERDSLSMNISEVMEYAGRCGISFNAREAYSACRGSFLGTRLCLMLAQRGENFQNLTAEGRLIRAVLQPGPVSLHGALTAAAAFPELPEEFLSDLRAFSAVTEFFGAELFTRAGIIRELERLRQMIPLVDIDRRTSAVKIHPTMIHAAYRVFFEFPENVQHDMRVCFARHFNRIGESFSSFLEYFLAGEYQLAADVRTRVRVSYFMLMRSSTLLQRFVTECPLSCKAAIPRILRMNALLMHSPLRPMLLGKFDEIISWVEDSEDHSAAEKRRLISYAYALKSNEDLYSLDKMGANIKRAYDLFKIRREYEAPKFPWTMYAPSVFCLIHRRGHSMQTENAQFTRYQHMYTEMLNHGKYAQMIFTGEMKYYQGDLTGGLELLSAAATFCSVREQGAIRLAALYSAAKCCLYLGDYEEFYEILTDIHDTEHAHANAEEGECAKLCLGLLRGLRGGGFDDMWYAICSEDTDMLCNRYTAPYFALVKAMYFLRSGKYDLLSGHTEQFFNAADSAENEAVSIALRLCTAQASLSLGSFERASMALTRALDIAMENRIPSALGEICAAFPELFGQIEQMLPEKYSVIIHQAQRLGAEFRRGVETVRTYEITYAASVQRDNFAEHYLAPLKSLLDSAESLRQELGLSVTAFKYAVMAASGLENKEICRLFSVSEDSVKSSLKRTFAALGVKNRRGLIGKIPTIK